MPLSSLSVERGDLASVVRASPVVYMSGAHAIVPDDLAKGDLASLHALLAGRTRGAALTALLDARLEAKNQNTLLTIAARHGQADAVRLLLESGASVGATTGRGSTALAIACQEGQLDCVRLLLGANADADQAKDTAPRRCS